MDTTLLLLGLACIIAAIVGGGLKAVGFEFPPLKSLRRQVLLTGFGLILIIVSRSIQPSVQTKPIISNLSVTTFREYDVDEGGLRAGAPAFIDNTSYYFTQVPSFLEGATYIKTANDDKCLSDPSKFVLRFDVSRRVTVYIAHDDRYATKPAWMLAFNPTKDSVNLNLPGAGAGRYTLYARDYSAGTVTLGGNIDGDCRIEGNYGMYSVIIVPQ